MKHSSALDRIRAELSAAEAKLASQLRKTPWYRGVLYADVERLKTTLNHVETAKLKDWMEKGNAEKGPKP